MIDKRDFGQYLPASRFPGARAFARAAASLVNDALPFLSPMTPLDLQFRLDDLLDEPRDFRGEIARESLDEVLVGLVGDLGYRARGPATVKGSAYRTRRDVFIEAELRMEVEFGCVRCLDPLGLSVACKVRHLLVPGKRDAAPADELTVDHENAADADEDLDVYEGDAIDLLPLLREDLLLELPMNPTCVEARGNACEKFDAVLAGAGRSSTADAAPAVDPRWAPLLELKKKLS